MPLAENDLDVPIRPISRPDPVYPPEAKRAEVDADVSVEIVVGPDGRVVEARSLTRAGYGLDEAAVQAIRAWRFSPPLRHGRPVRVRMRWPFRFQLR